MPAPGTSRWIIHPQQISQHLAYGVQRRAPVALSAPHGHWSAAMIALEEHALVLQLPPLAEPPPPGAYLHLDYGWDERHFQVEGRLGGAEAGLLRMGIPQRVQVRERRVAPRFRIPPPPTLHVKVPAWGEHTLPVCDVSAHGLGLLAPPDAPTLPENAIVRAVLMQEGAPAITLALDVRGQRPSETQGQFILGARIVELEEGDRGWFTAIVRQYAELQGVR